jgi:hypothetical protein
MTFLNPFLAQMLAEKVKQKIRLAATADSSDNLNKPVMLVRNQAIQVSRTHYSHGWLLF